jgi:hypothetical protein
MRTSGGAVYRPARKLRVGEESGLRPADVSAIAKELAGAKRRATPKKEDAVSSKLLTALWRELTRSATVYLLR